MTLAGVKVLNQNDAIAISRLAEELYRPFSEGRGRTVPPGCDFSLNPPTVGTRIYAIPARNFLEVPAEEIATTWNQHIWATGWPKLTKDAVEFTQAYLSNFDATNRVVAARALSIQMTRKAVELAFPHGFSFAPNVICSFPD